MLKSENYKLFPRTRELQETSSAEESESRRRELRWESLSSPIYEPEAAADSESGKKIHNGLFSSSLILESVWSTRFREKERKKLLKPSASSSFHAVFWHPVRVVLPRRERCFCLWGTYIVWRSKINDFCLYSYILTYISESNFKYFSLKSVEPMEKFPFNCCEQNEELAP